MGTKLLDIPMHDGSRHFATLPENSSWEIFRQHIDILEGAFVSDYLTDGITEMWLDFSFRGHSFTVNNQFGEFWFFVQDPCAPVELLAAVTIHFQTLLSEKS
jgi:hypothetical protein